MAVRVSVRAECASGRAMSRGWWSERVREGDLLHEEHEGRVEGVHRVLVLLAKRHHALDGASHHLHHGRGRVGGRIGPAEEHCFDGFCAHGSRRRRRRRLGVAREVNFDKAV